MWTVKILLLQMFSQRERKRQVSVENVAYVFSGKWPDLNQRTEGMETVQVTQMRTLASSL